MPGLSHDPDAAQRQLDALARGRQSQAQSLLERLGWTVKPGHQVHAYPDPEPEPPHGPIAPERDPERQPERPAGGGFLARLADGFRAGVEDS